MELTKKEKVCKTGGKMFAWVTLVVCFVAASVAYGLALHGYYSAGNRFWPRYNTLLFAVTFSGFMLAYVSFLLLRLIKKLEKKMALENAAGAAR